MKIPHPRFATLSSLQQALNDCVLDENCSMDDGNIMSYGKPTMTLELRSKLATSQEI